MCGNFKNFSQNENMGPLQENHSHNGPQKRRKFPPASQPNGLAR